MNQLYDKLGVKEGFRITIQSTPLEFKILESTFPEGVTYTKKIKGQYDFILIFVHTSSRLGEIAPEIIEALKEDALFWIAYPEKHAGLNTDLDKDNGWEIITKAGYRPVSQISLNDSWLALQFHKT